MMELASYGTSEMTISEMIGIEGGNGTDVLLHDAAFAAAYIAHATVNFVEGLYSGLTGN